MICFGIKFISKITHAHIPTIAFWAPGVNIKWFVKAPAPPFLCEKGHVIQTGFSALFQRNLCNFSCMVNNWAHTTLEESNKSLINLDSRTLFYLHHYSSKRIFSSLSRNVTCFLKQLFSVNLIYIYSSSSECYSNIVKKHIWKNYRII